jgi:hypothetical protein
MRIGRIRLSRTSSIKWTITNRRIKIQWSRDRMGRSSPWRRRRRCPDGSGVNSEAAPVVLGVGKEVDGMRGVTANSLVSLALTLASGISTERPPEMVQASARSSRWCTQRPEAPEYKQRVQGGAHWYVSNVSIIFDVPCLFLHHLPNVSLHLVALLCDFRN